MTLVASDMRRPGEPLTAGARPIRSVPSRPAKVVGESGKFSRWLFASRLYSLTLGYGTPRSFFAVAPDTWPGDPATGQRLLLGELLARGSCGRRGARIGRSAVAARGRAALWLDALNGFGWLRDLRDCGDPNAAPLAVRLVDDWTEREWRWSPAHLAARRAGRAHRLVDPPLRLAVDGRRSGLRRPPRASRSPASAPISSARCAPAWSATKRSRR